MKRQHIYLSLATSLILILSLLLMGAGGCPVTDRYSLTINVSPEEGGSVSPSGGSYDPGVTVTIVATANSGYEFDYWSGGASGTDPTATVVMDADKSVTANFKTSSQSQPQFYTLDTTVSPSGSGSVSPSGGEFEPGVQIALTAIPAEGYVFDYWSGDASSTDATTTVVMDSDRSVTANFITAGYEVLFTDDFSDPSTGWATFDASEGQAAYQDGYFYIKDSVVDSTPVYSGVAYPLTNLILEVETWLVGGTDDNFHQVLCRFQDGNNYYSFGISADGYYSIIKVAGGEQTLLDSGYSEYINQGVGAVNLMYVECIDSHLTLGVNGYIVTDLFDHSFSEGYPCLAAIALSDDFTEVAFDNLVVSGPSGETGETGGGETGGGETGDGETEWTLIFEDDFDDPGSGWATFDEPEGQASYLGYLDIKDYATDYTATFSGIAYPLTDFALEVKTWLADGSDDNWQGVLCRYQDEENFYFFAISADGYYYIAKFVNGEEIPLDGDYSDDVYYGWGVSNSIRVECIGSSLSLSANGSVLATVTDTTFSEGYLCLAAWALSDTYTEVGFDNLAVYGPSGETGGTGDGETGGGETGGGETGGAALFSDDFSQDTGDWETYADMHGEVFYKNEELHLINYTSSLMPTRTILYQYCDDFSLEVETKLVSGTPDNLQEVICRWQNENTYYSFAISGDGYYYITKWVNGNETLLSSYDSPYINQGTGAVNTIGIVCISSNLSLFVNGYLMDTIIDSSFYGGYIGFSAKALASTSTHIAFDNLVVTEEERS